MSDRDWNPRYWLFARSQGHTPKEQMAADDKTWPGGLMTGFICWIGERWRDFCKEHGYRNYDQARLNLGNKTDETFDRWLRALVDKTTSPEPQ